MKNPPLTSFLMPLTLAALLLASAPSQAQQKLQIAGNFATEHPSSVAV
jgi:hypothetical protein